MSGENDLCRSIIDADEPRHNTAAATATVYGEKATEW